MYQSKEDYEESISNYYETNVKKFRSNANKSKTLMIESNRKAKELIMAAISEQEELVSREIERFVQNTSLMIERLRNAERDIKRSVDDTLKKVRRTRENLIESSIENVMKQSLKRFEEESTKQTAEFEKTLSVTLKAQKKVAQNRKKQFEENLTKLQRRENKAIKDAIESIEVSIEQANCEVGITEKLINTVESITVSKCRNVLSGVLESSLEMKRVLNAISSQSVIPQSSKAEFERIVDNNLRIIMIGSTESGKQVYLDLEGYSSDSD